jgi:uncharacterized protein (DUF58 family)
VALARPSVEVRRSFQPTRLSVGALGHVVIDVSNRAAFRSPTFVVSDTFAGRRTARIVVRPLGARRRARAAYRAPTSRRGVFAVGPLQVSMTDTLGVVARVVLERPATQVIVYPRVWEVAALPMTAGPDLVGGALGRMAQARAGQEFHSLREYVVGDDLRRVHWRSTARTGLLMVREDDVPWQLRATLLLDTWAGRYVGDGFEVAVESAASVLARLRQSGALVRFMATAEPERPAERGRRPETRFADGHEHVEALMETLATVQPMADDRFSATLARLRGESGGGALVACVGAATEEDLGRLAMLRHRFAAVIVLRHGGGAAAGGGSAVRHGRRGAVVVDVAEGAGLPSAWASAVAAALGSAGRRAGGWR